MYAYIKNLIQNFSKLLPIVLLGVLGVSHENCRAQDTSAFVCELHFPVASVQIDSSFQNNEENIQALSAFLQNTPPRHILSVQISSTTSLEGNQKNNISLAENYAACVRTFLEKRWESHFNDSTCWDVISEGEDWEGVITALKNSDIAYADEAVKIIEEVPYFVYGENDTVVSSRKKELMDLRGGIVWHEMVAKIFPSMHAASVTIRYQEASEAEVETLPDIETEFQNNLLQPSFWESVYHFIVFLPSVICLLWFVLLAFRGKKNNRPQRIFVYVLVLCFVGGLYGAFYSIDYLESTAVFISLDFFFSMNVLSCTYIMAKVLTSNQPLKAKDFGWFVAPCVFGFIALIIQNSVPSDDFEEIINQIFSYNFSTVTFSSSQPYYTLLFWLILVPNIVLYAVQIVGVGISIIKFVYNYSRHYREYYEYPDSSELKANHGAIIYLCIFLIVFISEAVYLFLGGMSYFVLAVIFLLFTGLLFMFCLHVGMITYTIQMAVHAVPQKKPEHIARVPQETSAAVADDKKCDAFYHQFDILMHQKQYYKNPDLNSEMMAKKLNTNRTYLSEMVHSRYGCSFSEYVAKLRVEHARNFMYNNPQANLFNIAKESGFSSVETFCRTYKKSEGTSPKASLNAEVKS